jgi:type VI secretion system protein VasD
MALAACADSVPTKIAIEISATGSVNPDLGGRPSPVVTQIYQLSSDDRFAKADIIQLIDHDKDLLGSDMLTRDEVILQPGESKTIDLAYLKDAKYLGFVADYRDIDHANARALLMSPKKDKIIVKLKVDKLAVSATQSEQK